MPPPKTPLLATDVIIELLDRPGCPIVLIERKNRPHGWAIPGGFVEVGETVENAAVREAEEETGLKVRLTYLLGIYSDPARDPRGHTVSVVWIARSSGDPVAADDAKSVKVFNLEDVPLKMPFDHAAIIMDYRKDRVRKG